MSIAQRQHYVPKFFLRQFTNQDGILFTVRKGTPPLAINPVTPANLFVEKDLYKHDGILTTIKTDLEAKFSNIESRFSPLQKEILATIREGKTPHLHSDEKIIFSKFVLTQGRRVPDKISDDLHLAKEIVERRIKQVERDFESHETPYTSSNAIEEYADIIQKSAMVEPTPQIIQRMCGAKHYYMKIEVPKCSFVTGSNPVVLNLRFPESTDNNRGISLFFAISYDVGVVISESLDLPIERVIYQKSVAREFNEFVRDQSTIIAGRSYELIRSLSKKWK